MNYTDALPFYSPCVDNDRKSTYKKFLKDSNKNNKQVKSKSRKCYIGNIIEVLILINAIGY